MASVTINGTALVPQPRSIRWQPATLGGVVNGTDALGAAYTVTLTSPPMRGGTANFNWTSFENATLTSITIPTRPETLKASSFTTYNSTVVSKPVRQVSSVPGNLLEGVSIDVLVVV